MTGEAPPLVAAAPRRSIGQRLLWRCIGGALRVSLLVSPRPAALLVRRAFAAGGARTAGILERHAPQGISAIVDEPYGDERDTVLDVYRPASLSGPLPLVLWVHGGGWVGGAKDELAGWCRLIASQGHVVAAPRYSLAPERRYPTPPRQMMAALAHLQSARERLGIDTARIAIGGDSAGAQIAAQLGALVTTPGYADLVGVAPTITPAQLRGLVLCCGPYDLGLARQAASPAGARFMRAVLLGVLGRAAPAR